MKRFKWLLLSTAAMTLSVLATWAAPEGKTTTVGDFALKISRAMGQRPADQTAAVRALRKAGVDLGEDVSVSLTEGRVVRILRSLGLKVTDPQEPAAQISAGKADQIVKAVSLSRGNVSTVSARDDRRDCHASSSDPEDCHGHDDDDDHHDHDGHDDDD